jgi:uncharacterized glyoxalase superfamily protein PhnB
MSLFVDFDGAADLHRAFERLAEDGDMKMPLADYGFNARFGWLTDRFGVSWQLNLLKGMTATQSFASFRSRVHSLLLPNQEQ